MMTIDKDKLNKIANGEYINNPFDLMQQLEIKEQNDIITFLSLVYSYNEGIIANKKRDILYLKKQEKESNFTDSDSIVSSSIVQKEVEPFNIADNNEQQEEINNRVKEIMLKIESSPIDDIFKYLPSREDIRFHAIMNQLMIAYYKEIAFYNIFLLESKNKTDEQNEILPLLERKSNIFEILKDYRFYTSEEECQTVSNIKPILIHLETTKNYSLFSQDIEQFPYEAYKYFLKIYEPFILGQPIKLRNMHGLNGLFYLKNKVHQARIYMTHISSNIYVVLGALNKKTTWGSLEAKFISSRYTTWNLQKRSILSKLDDSSFIEEQNEKTEKILKLLKGEI